MAHIYAEPSTGTKRPLPPYISATTFLSTIEGWRAVRPSRVDRSVLHKVAGSMQTWLISALKYFSLVDEAGVPTPLLDHLATASETERPKLIAEMLRAGYPYLFSNGVDLSNITHNDLRQKFTEAGAQGDTATKAMSFFTAMAKAAGLKVSPYVATRQRRTNGGAKRAAKAKPESTPPPTPPPVTPPARTDNPKSAFEVLYELLDLDGMEETEQQAVWTLLRYLKKRGS